MRPAEGFDVALYEARSRAYVSLPKLNAVAIVDMGTWTVVDSVFVGTRPHGLDQSHHGSTLYCALSLASSAAYLDLDTLTVSDTLNIGVELDSAETWDIVEAQPDRVFVSSNPSSSGFAYIVEIRRDLGNATQRVASNRIIRCAPNFAVSDDETAQYVGECFSPNSIYELDQTQDDAPIVAEDNHGSISGSFLLEVSPDGSRLFNGGGQILDTETITPVGLIGPGVSRLTDDSLLAYVATANGAVEVRDVPTMHQVDTITFPCGGTGASEVQLIGGGAGFVVL